MYSKSKKSKRRQILQLDYDDESSRSTPSPSTVQSNGRHASPTPTPVAVIKLPPTQPSTQPPTVMDDEFANFMAEIDAMDDDGTPEHPNNEDTPEPPPPPPPAPVEEVEETFDMQEPVCKWQQCLDENTSCYYYWHMDNNDVSWDIPTEFTQHLLRHREYEEALAAFNASKAARDARKALVQAPPPPPPPPSADGDEVSETEVEPSTEQGRNFLWFMRDHEREEKAKQEENKRAYAQKFVKGKTLDEERKEIPSVEDPKRDDDREEILKRLSGHSVAMLQGKGRSKFLQRIGAYDQEPDSRSQSPTIARETVAKAASEVVKETTEDEEDEEEDEMALLLELQQKQEELIALEMEVCSPSSMTPEPPPPEPQAETPAPPPPPPPPPDDDEPPLPPEPDLEPPSKKAKVEEKTKTDGAEETPTGDQTKRENFVPKEGSLALTKDQSEIEDLSSVLVNKLECMQITRESLTKMQILLVEIQTRIVDWVAGALSTSHLLTKLRDAEKQITDYETIATPPGWTCHYDRDCKQYYYMNDESGELQWDYPITKADLPLDFGAKETTNESEPRNGAVPPPPKPRTPSPPPPPVQAPFPPVQAPPPPAMAPPPPPPPGIVSKAIPDMPPPPPPPGLEPSSSENIDMEIDEEGEVTVPELLPPPVPAALRPKAQPPQYYAPMGHYYPRPRPYAPMGPYSYPMDPNYYGAPAPAPPPSAPEPPPRPAHVSAGPVLFSAKENKMEKAPSPPLPPETKPSAPEPPKPPTPDSVVAAPAPPSPASESVPISGRKRKKKDKLKVNDSLSLKKKNVSGLVMKWQQAQQQVTQEVSKRGPDDT